MTFDRDLDPTRHAADADDAAFAVDRQRVADGSLVLMRTRRGARELLEPVSTLDPSARRLLARVNGFTELRFLLATLPSDAETLHGLVESLLRAGLVTAVEAVHERERVGRVPHQDAKGREEAGQPG